MFRRLHNHARFEFALRNLDPLSIVEGGLDTEPDASDMPFVRTVTPDGRRTVYLPGSSLKGVLRAHVERILRTLLGDEAARDPFDPEFRDERRGERSTAQVYRESCEASRLFGSLVLAGRLRVGDAFPVPGENLHLDVRNHVGIERPTQASKGGVLFDVEAVVSGTFAVRIDLENFTLAQLALVLHALSDLHQGFLQIGHGKSRGYGSVEIKGEPTPRLEVLTLRGRGLVGVGALEPDGEYGLPSGREDALREGHGGVEETPTGLWAHRLVWEGTEQWWDLLDALAKGPAASLYSPQEG